ncbi:hypothetical protein J2W57_001553 [Chryseobacterium ginsenosidimutans]|nr:hypothetical protein [Chryseobacterium ginsenosidimutans]
MQFFTKGKAYQGDLKRVKGKMKVFFKTNSPYYKQAVFDLPIYCCSNIRCRYKSLRKWKEDIVNRIYTDAVIIPE